MATESVEFFIPAIHCDGCLQTVARVAQTGGAQLAAGDASTKLVRLSFETGAATPAALADALTAIGFPPEERA